MRILFVINNAFTQGNGLAASCRRTVRCLREAGEDVRVLSAVGARGERPDYALPGTALPLFDGLVRRQGYAFAKPVDSIICEAVRWADVVHLEEPFNLQIRACRIAEQEGRPLTATYHLHPENLFASVHLQGARPLDAATMLAWRDTVFDHCRIVQCPTEKVRRRLERWRFKPELRVISNGMIPMPEAREETGPGAQPAPEPGRGSDNPDFPDIPDAPGAYTVVAAGRYSVEKDQATLLRAMRHCGHARSIRLVLAGRGPTERSLRRQAARLVREGVLAIPPVFTFCTPDELRRLYSRADLYVHCAFVEVEGMSCMEAVQTGLVPVIADGPLASTPQFALSPESVFRAGDARGLAVRIDYWLVDDARRHEEARRYPALAAKYDIRTSVAELRRMFRDAAR